MDRVEIGRYKHPETHGYFGWMRSKNWIVFISDTNEPVAFKTNADGSVIESA